MEQWGKLWEDNFAPEKTLVMVISRSPVAAHTVLGGLRFGDKSPSLQDCIKILGVSVDCSLRFNHHIAAIARQTSLRVSALRRMVDTLGSRGILILYEAQMRPYMEYGGCPDLNVECRRPHTETERCAEASSATGG